MAHYICVALIITMEQGQLEEAKLIAAVQADPNQFVLLYDRHFDAVYGLLASRIADKTLVEDLTAETFYKALSAMQRYRYRGKPFRAWLYRIALNELAQHFRRVKKEQNAQTMWQWVQSACSDELNSFSEEQERENLQTVNGAIPKLNQQDQNLLTLRFYEDLSYQQIADVLETSTNNVGVKLNRALKRLSKLCNVNAL